MKLYHVNTEGKAGACGATKGKCPFGRESDHFTSLAAARLSFEKDQEASLAGARKSSLKTAAPKSLAEFDEAISSVPTVEDSKVINPPAIDDNSGYLGGRRYLGFAGSQIKSYVGQKEAAAGIRDLINKAKSLGEIPSWLDISVTKNPGSTASSLSFVVGYKPEGSKKAKAIPASWLEEAKDPGSWKRAATRDKVKKLEAYLQCLSKQFESSDNNGSVDYFNSHNSAYLRWREDWEQRD